MKTNNPTEIVTVTMNELKGHVKQGKPLSLVEVADLTVYDFNIKPAVRNSAKFIIFRGLFGQIKMLKGMVVANSFGGNLA